MRKVSHAGTRCSPTKARANVCIFRTRVSTGTSVNIAGHTFDIEGNLISREEFERRKDEWLPTMEDREYVRSLMHPVSEPGKIANWIAPPAAGIKGKPFEFEYVRL